MGAAKRKQWRDMTREEQHRSLSRGELRELLQVRTREVMLARGQQIHKELDMAVQKIGSDTLKAIEREVWGGGELDRKIIMDPILPGRGQSIFDRGSAILDLIEKPRPPENTPENFRKWLESQRKDKPTLSHPEGYALIAKAAHFAANAHKKQTRRFGGGAYIAHPMRVAGSATLMQMLDYAVAAAWLHDVVEDCEIRLSTIEEEFGHHVKWIVSDLTNVKIIGASRLEQKLSDRERLSSICSDSKLIKLLDRYDNVSDPTMALAPPEWQATYCDETLELLKVVGYISEPISIAITNEVSRIRQSLRAITEITKQEQTDNALNDTVFDAL